MGTNEAFTWIAGEVDKRRKRKQPFITLLDGDPKLWNKLPEILPADTIGILDIIHVTQYVWKAAKVFCKSSDEIKAFARERILWILQGRVSSVIRGFKHMSTARKLRGKPKEKIATVCGYFSKHLDHMRYDEYLREGYLCRLKPLRGIPFRNLSLTGIVTSATLEPPASGTLAAR